MNKAYFSIIYEDKDILVINKAAGLQVHPDGKNENETLTDKLIKIYPEIEQAKEDPLRPGIVHRLDRDTRGLMLIVRNKKAFDYYKELFQKREIQKKYWVLVHGKVKKQEGIIDFSIGRAPKNTVLRSTAPYARDQKKAKSEYQVLNEYCYEQSKSKVYNYTLLEVKIITGRTHQIRVHMKSIGHPVVGDKLYKFKRQFVPFDFKEMFLIAKYLKFVDRKGEVLKFKIELDSVLNEFLANLKN